MALSLAAEGEGAVTEVIEDNDAGLCWGEHVNDMNTNTPHHTLSEVLSRTSQQTYYKHIEITPDNSPAHTIHPYLEDTLARCMLDLIRLDN